MHFLVYIERIMIDIISCADHHRHDVRNPRIKGERLSFPRVIFIILASHCHFLACLDCAALEVAWLEEGTIRGVNSLVVEGRFQ